LQADGLAVPAVPANKWFAKQGVLGYNIMLACQLRCSCTDRGCLLLSVRTSRLLACLQELLPPAVQQLLPAVCSAAARGLQLLPLAVANPLAMRQQYQALEAVDGLMNVLVMYVNTRCIDADRHKFQQLIMPPGG
jgi:hypothetical protein